MMWHAVGPGGGGGHFFPSFSPADANLMMFSCDMGGIYISHNGAKSWRMLPGDTARKLTGYPAFHPTDPDTIFLNCTRGLLVSRDRGRTWERALGKELGFRGQPYQGTPDTTGIAIDPDNPDVIIAGFSRFEGTDGSFVFISMSTGLSPFRQST